MPLVTLPEMSSLGSVTAAEPAGRQAKKMVLAVMELTRMTAPVLATELTLMPMILGVTEAAELWEASLLMKMLVTCLPTSCWLQEVRNWVTVTLRGGQRTLFLGSRSKQRYMVGVVRLWTMGQLLVSLKLRVSGGGTILLPSVTVQLQRVCWGRMLMIFGVMVKLLRAEEYCVSVWLASSATDMKRVISVEEGRENLMGMTTGQPTVESVMEGMLMVGVLASVDPLEAVTVMVTGRMFLQLVWLEASDLVKQMTQEPAGMSERRKSWVVLVSVQKSLKSTVWGLKVKALLFMQAAILRLVEGLLSPQVMLQASPALMMREYSSEMGILSAVKVRQLVESTTEEDSKRKLLETVSMMRMTKKVCARMLVSVVLQLVGREGLRREVTVRVRVEQLAEKACVTMISPLELVQLEAEARTENLQVGGLLAQRVFLQKVGMTMMQEIVRPWMPILAPFAPVILKVQVAGKSRSRSLTVTLSMEMYLGAALMQQVSGFWKTHCSAWKPLEMRQQATVKFLKTQAEGFWMLLMKTQVQSLELTWLAMPVRQTEVPTTEVVGQLEMRVPASVEALLSRLCMLLQLRREKMLFWALRQMATEILVESMQKLSGKVMPRLLGAKVEMGAILKTQVDMRPASLGKLSSCTWLDWAEAQELERMVRELLVEEAYWVPLLLTQAEAEQVLLMGLTRLRMRLREDWEEASMEVVMVSTLLMFCRVQTGAMRVVLSQEEQEQLPSLLLPNALGSAMQRMLSPLKTSEQLSWKVQVVLKFWLQYWGVQERVQVLRGLMLMAGGTIWFWQMMSPRQMLLTQQLVTMKTKLELSTLGFCSPVSLMLQVVELESQVPLAQMSTRYGVLILQQQLVLLKPTSVQVAALATMSPQTEGIVMESAPLAGTKWFVLMLKRQVTPISPPLREETEMTPKLNSVHFSTVLLRLTVTFRWKTAWQDWKTWKQTQTVWLSMEQAEVGKLLNWKALVPEPLVTVLCLNLTVPEAQYTSTEVHEAQVTATGLFLSSRVGGQKVSSTN